jgi:hypothetical protein
VRPPRFLGPVTGGLKPADAGTFGPEWAIREAAVRHAPLTVLTVQQAVTGYWGGPVLYPADPELSGSSPRPTY